MPMPRHLNSIALKVFLNEYEFFASRPRNGDYLVKKGIGAAWRIGAAQKLFSSPDLLREALEYIIFKSKKATTSQKEKAAGLLRDLRLKILNPGKSES